jgi:multidrug efflux pump subunit AcrA (membrane-fusion protein)
VRTAARWRVAAIAAGGLLVATVGWTVAGNASDEADAGTDETAELGTAEVEQRDLERVAEYDGTIGYGEAGALPGSAAGTVTWTPDVGSVVAAGEVLYEVDGQPVVLVPGEVPVYRRLAYAEGPGEDVEQLERFLADAGFGSDDLVIDEEWTSATTTAVQRWQESLGLEETGEIEMGRIVFGPTSVRVESVTAAPGERAEGSVLSVTDTAQVVSIDVDASESDRLPVDTAVSVELDDGRVLEGTVTDVGAPETADDSNSFPGGDSGDGSTVPVTITLAGANAEEDLPGAGSGATVRLTLDTAEGVTAVPVSALLALSEGGYAIEVVDDASTRATHLVAVDLGMFADGWVQVDGEVRPGDSVVVP